MFSIPSQFLIKVTLRSHITADSISVTEQLSSRTPMTTDTSKDVKKGEVSVKAPQCTGYRTAFPLSSSMLCTCLSQYITEVLAIHFLLLCYSQ